MAFANLQEERIRVVEALKQSYSVRLTGFPNDFGPCCSIPPYCAGGNTRDIACNSHTELNTFIMRKDKIGTLNITIVWD
jgi:hypothetical protein